MVGKISSRARLLRRREGSETLYVESGIISHVARAKPPGEEERQIIIAKYQAGDGLASIAADVHRSRITVRRVLGDAGISVSVHRTGVPHANTSIELRLHDALRSLGIGFTTQRRCVKRYVVDICINQAPVIIEADGVHHSFPGGQDHMAIRDKAHVDAGFRMFHFTGSQINTDAMKCIQEVVDACGLTPDVDPVYDIKTKFTGPDHPNWTDDWRDFACEKCGTVFRARSSVKGGKNIFCGMKCYNAAKFGRKLSESHKKAIGDGIRGKPRKKPDPIWCDICKRGWAPSNYSRHVRKYHEGGNWNQTKIESDLTGDGESSTEMIEPAELISK